MAVRPVDGNGLVDTLKQIVSDYTSHGMYPSAFPIEYAIEIVEKMPTLTQPNETLALEQLREMDGEPVYFHNLFPAKRKFEWQWALVCKERGNAEATTYTYRFLDYGKTWIAYRRPPEGEEDI